MQELVRLYLQLRYKAFRSSEPREKAMYNTDAGNLLECLYDTDVSEVATDIMEALGNLVCWVGEDRLIGIFNELMTPDDPETVTPSGN